MRQLFVVLVVLFAVALLVNVIATMTRRARRRLEVLEQLQELVPPRVERDANPSSTAVGVLTASQSLIEAPETERSGFYLRRVLGADGLRGLCFVPVLLLFLVANTRLLAEAFALMLDHPGNPLGQANVFGLGLAVTDLHLYGLALSAALILVGGVYAGQCDRRSPARWFTLLVVLVPLVVYETFISSLRGYQLGAENPDASISAAALAFQNGLQGFFSATVEALSGYYVIEAFLIPSLQMVLWTVIAPIRGVRLALELRRAARKLAEKQREAGPRVVELRPEVGFLTRAGACLDEALFEPMRALDRAVLDRLGRIFRRPSEVTHG